MGSVVQRDGQYEAEDFVSVWIGVFPNKGEFDEYLMEHHADVDEDDFPKCHFWEDLGIRWHDHDFQEAVFRPENVAVKDLIANISWVESYKVELLIRCKEMGIDKGNAAVVIYEYNYPTTVGFHSPCMMYVGSFRYFTDNRPFRRNSP